jgi:zinc/manganese transport system substrate-binding protein
VAVPRSAAASALLALCALALSACGAAHPANPRTGARVVHVVAGENTWGDIATQLGGAHALVTSILHDPGADPHLYESDPRDAARVETANLVIVNGAGYDGFMTKLLGASSSKGRTVLTVASILHATGSDPNPHFWYAAARVPTVAAAIERALAREDPADRAMFAARLRHFDASLRPLMAAIAAIARTDAGAPVAYTERVPGYLVVEAGLTDATPSGFARAIEDGDEPSPQDTQTMDALVGGRHIRALLLNTQATSPATKHLATLARQAGVPVVAVTETLPPAQRTFQAWQLAQARALQAALDGGR